ncbi:hypothetical protein [Haliangium sp.]|uniref:hypothetical protein n=1 Tax=Haliangium sp. TaxID=2663208 RepID=UPI003D0DB9B3
MAEPLALLVRSGKLAAPNRRDFDRQAWTRAYAALPADDATASFFASAMWFADQLEAVHHDIAALRLARVDRERLKRELCGRCNYAYVYSEARLRLAMAEAGPGDLPMGSPAHLLFSAHTGDTGNADAWRTGLADTLGKALRHLFASGTVKSGPGFGAAALAEAAFEHFNRLYVLEFYCEKLVWQDWRVMEEGAAWRIVPPDPDPFGRSTIAVDWRRDQEHGEWTIVAGTAWREKRGFPERIAERNEQTGTFGSRLRFPGEGDIPPEAVLRWIVAASDLEDIVSAPLPIFAPLKVTLGDLIHAALLIGSAARVMTDELLALGPEAAFKRFAPTFTPADIDALFADLDWAAPKRKAVVDFFTYRGQALDGVWSKPLVESRWGLMPILPAIVAPNLYRSAELWLMEAGGDALQRERGNAFEARARQELAAALKAAGLELTVKIAPPFTVKIAGSRRDIDLALRIGCTVFVGEAKLKRFPAAPRESGRWIDELAKGAGQARLRCEHFEKKPGRIAQLTGYSGDPKALRFRPFVLASGSFGAGVTIAGVSMVDFDSFKEFFDPGYFGVLGEIKPGSGMVAVRTVPFRDDDADLAICLEAYLAEPVRVRMIEAAMVPLARTIGIEAVDGRAILCTEPMVDHCRFVADASDWLEAEARRIWRGALAKVRPTA